MLCHKCGSDNPADNLFCIFCGSAFTEEIPEELQPGQLPEHRQSSPSGTEPDLSELLRSYSTRISAIELHLGLTPSVISEPSSFPATNAPLKRADTKSDEQKVTSENASQTARPTQLRNIPSGNPGGRLSIDWEQIIGKNWLAIIGAITLTIGMGFFLKLAIENDWIGERGQIIIGLVTGLGMLAVGESTHRIYARWAQATTGSGIAILYLSIYAAFGFYQVLEPVLAFSFLGLVVFLTGVLAIRQESLVIALLAVSTAFLTPVLLGGALQPSQHYLLLLYILTVDVGVLVISTFRNWRWLTLIGILASYLLFLIWIEAIPTPSLFLAQSGLTGIFLIFAGATTLFHVIWRRTPRPLDMPIMMLNALLYFGITNELLWEQYQGWLGPIAIALSLFYSVIGYGAIKGKNIPPQVALFSFATALIFATLSVPLQLSGVWITVAWATEGAVLIWIGFLLKNSPTRAFALVILSIAALRLIVSDTNLDVQEFRLVLNERFPTFVISIAAFYVATYFYKIERAQLEHWERFIYLGLLVTANFLTLWLLSAEVFDFFNQPLLEAGIGEASKSIRAAENNLVLSLTIIWSLYAFVLFAGSILRHSNYMRWIGLGLLTLVVGKFIIVDTAVVSVWAPAFRPILNSYFITFISVMSLMVIGIYAYQVQKENLVGYERNGFMALLAVANLVALFGLSTEAIHFWEAREDVLLSDQTSAKHLSLTVLWTVYAISAIALGILRQSITIRLAGIVLVAIPIVKLFTFDIFLLEHGYRVAAFVTLGLLLLATGLAYQRYSEAFRGFLFGRVKHTTHD